MLTRGVRSTEQRKDTAVRSEVPQPLFVDGSNSRMDWDPRHQPNQSWYRAPSCDLMISRALFWALAGRAETWVKLREGTPSSFLWLNCLSRWYPTSHLGLLPYSLPVVPPCKIAEKITIGNGVIEHIWFCTYLLEFSTATGEIMWQCSLTFKILF